MALKAFCLGAVQADSTLFGGITQMGVNTGTEVHSEANTGELYPRFQCITGQKPGASFTTYAIAKALGFAGLLGAKVGALTNGLVLYLVQKADEAGRLGNGNHTKYVFRKGICVPRTLSCDHQGNFTLPLDVMATWDETNDPIIPTHDVNLPAGLVDTERYGLGPITIADIVQSAAMRFQLEFGINAVTKGSGSGLWDTFSCVEGVVAVLRLTGIDPTIFATSGAIPLAGKAGTHANTIVYLRKRDEGGGFVADNVAEHIKLTAAGLAYIETPAEASGGDDSETSLVMPLKFDGTNDQVVINTAAAIV